MKSKTMTVSEALHVLDTNVVSLMSMRLRYPQIFEAVCVLIGYAEEKGEKVRGDRCS